MALVLILAACGASGGSDSSKTDSPTTTARGGTPSTTAPGGEKATTTASEDTTTTTEAPGDPDQALHDAAEATLAATAFRVESDANLQIGAQNIHLQASGPIDYDTVVADVMISVEQGSQTQDVEIRADGSTFWVRTEGGDGPTIPEGKTWVEGDISRLRNAPSLKPSGLIGVVLALLGSKDAEATGTDTIDGVDVLTYQTTVSYADAVEAAGDRAAAFKSALSLTAGEDPKLAIEAAVGDDGVVRNMDLDIQTSSTTPLDGTYTVDITDVGQPVDKPDPPPAEDTLTGPQADTILDQLIH